MKKKFADFLKFRDTPLKFEDSEQEFDLKLPPIYKSFMSNFEGIYGDIIRNQEGELETLSYYQYVNKDGNDILFEDFLEIEKVFENHRNSDTWVANGVIPISSHSHGGTILVGYHISNMDKLYFEYDRGLELIEQDIFSFLGNLIFISESDDNKIVKKWGQDYWEKIEN